MAIALGSRPLTRRETAKEFDILVKSAVLTTCKLLGKQLY